MVLLAPLLLRSGAGPTERATGLYRAPRQRSVTRVTLPCARPSIRPGAEGESGRQDPAEAAPRQSRQRRGIAIGSAARSVEAEGRWAPHRWPSAQGTATDSKFPGEWRMASP